MKNLAKILALVGAVSLAPSNSLYSLGADDNSIMPTRSETLNVYNSRNYGLIAPPSMEGVFTGINFFPPSMTVTVKFPYMDGNELSLEYKLFGFPLGGVFPLRLTKGEKKPGIPDRIYLHFKDIFKKEFDFTMKELDSATGEEKTSRYDVNGPDKTGYYTAIRISP